MKHVGTFLPRTAKSTGTRTVHVYGRVFFALRERFGLSVGECLLLDVIDTLSRKTGWCFASRPYLANLLGISVRSLQRIIARLTRDGLLEKHPCRPGHLRTSSKWRRARVSLSP